MQNGKRFGLKKTLGILLHVLRKLKVEEMKLFCQKESIILALTLLRVKQA